MCSQPYTTVAFVHSSDMNLASPQDGGWTGMGAPSDGRGDQDLQQTGNDDMPDWDDDDLAAMQAEPMVTDLKTF